MLKTRMMQPEILSALASAGHGSKVLIADSNYPYCTSSGPNAKIVYLNFAPGLLQVTDVLTILAETIPIEHCEVMVVEQGTHPPIYQEFTNILGGMELHHCGRFKFYEAVKSTDCCLIIATGDERKFANILLTIGEVHH